MDTNIVVRLLVRDDPRQAAVAREIMSRDFTLLPSVLVEVEWVLRAAYQWPRDRIAVALREIADLPTLCDAPAGLGWIIDRFAAGADLADMVHVAGTSPAQRFVTFDRRLARAAGPDAPVEIETLT